jgi:hypothetical protein
VSKLGVDATRLIQEIDRYLECDAHYCQSKKNSRIPRSQTSLFLFFNYEVDSED